MFAFVISTFHFHTFPFIQGGQDVCICNLNLSHLLAALPLLLSLLISQPPGFKIAHCSLLPTDSFLIRDDLIHDF